MPTTLTNIPVLNYFPVGTTVGAYPRSQWPATTDSPNGAAPPGAATASAAVAADGTLSLTGLATNTQYWLGANLTPWKYIAAGTYDPASQRLTDGQNVATGTTTGSMIGTSTTEKIGFHGSAPTAQRAGAAQAAAASTAATQTTPYGFSTAAQADAIVALVNELRAALVAKGIIKGSA